ncbi:hypothetical protein A3G69_05940 [Candidatus Peribacteria bacterium RIFCSPLOWO2_12_FULL_53_10]|nr:MAG: hypothetical protein A3G69_05940 [Candidatus Peribacteria bacterium RIFCSPLOWO2_12_FULL_53_10]
MKERGKDTISLRSCISSFLGWIHIATSHEAFQRKPKGRRKIRKRKGAECSVEERKRKRKNFLCCIASPLNTIGKAA